MENLDLNFDAINTNFLAPLLGLLGNDELKKNLEEFSPLAQEVGRIFYSNNTVTVNLTAVALAALAGFLLLLKLFFGLTLFDVMDAMTGATPHYGGTGYGAPATGYGAPTQSYGAPASTGYAAPASGYSSRSSYEEDDVQLTPEQKALYPELTKLQDQLDQLKESEVNLRHQIFYNGDSDVPNTDSGHIGYSY